MGELGWDREGVSLWVWGVAASPVGAEALRASAAWGRRQGDVGCGVSLCVRLRMFIELKGSGWGRSRCLGLGEE